MLGIMVGTASVVALVSSGNLASEKAMELFKSLGTEQMSLSISPKKNKENKIRIQELLDIKNSIAEIKYIAPYATEYFRGSYANIVLDVSAIGSMPVLAKIIKLSLQKGRFLVTLDAKQNFCVIGANLFEQLKTKNPIGQRLRLGKMIFTIVGVLKSSPSNSFFSGDVNESIIVPFSAMQRLTSPVTLSDVIMELHENSDIDKVKESINAYFQKHFPNVTVSVQSAKEMIKSMNAQQQTLTLLLLFIGGISLFVGGNRGHEHHAGVDFRTSLRNWATFGHWGTTCRHQENVFNRSRDAVCDRRRGRGIYRANQHLHRGFSF
jgi:putative ABC transport system permease protein